jgi:isocitrate dehydrogenase
MSLSAAARVLRASTPTIEALMATLAFPVSAARSRALTSDRAPDRPRSAPVTLIAGDGIGPEVVAAVQRVLAAAGAQIAWEEAPAGTSAVGAPGGLPRETIDSIERTGTLLKGPLTTPAGSGMKSANVTLRKLFETFANVRPARELPGIWTPFTGRGVDLVIVRENVEDLYAGIEHMQTPTVAQALKLVTRAGCERVARFACELAEDEGRPRITCATKSNILKLTEGMMQRVCEEVAADYPRLAFEHLLVDNVAHQLVRRPETFDVIVTTNMNGDILSDLAAGLVGGLGVAPSANIGHEVAIFEAVHGAAPDIAGRDLANPTALLLSASMMLRHLAQVTAADRVELALEATLRAGFRTRDLGDGPLCLGTAAFADRVIERLDAAHQDVAVGGRASPRRPRGARLHPEPERPVPARASTPQPREVTVGLDVFVQSDWLPEQIGHALGGMTAGTPLELLMVSNRGTQVYPSVGGAPGLVDHYRCRFVARNGATLAERDLFQLLERIALAFRWVHVERLREFDGRPGFTQAQGQR